MKLFQYKALNSESLSLELTFSIAQLFFPNPKERARQDSNLKPSASEADTLSVELRARKEKQFTGFGNKLAKKIPLHVFLIFFKLKQLLS